MSPLATALAFYAVSLVVLAAIGWSVRRLVRATRLSAGGGRKVLHVVSGLWVVPFVLLVPDWRLAAVPVLFVLSANAQGNAGRVPVAEVRALQLTHMGAVVALLVLWSRGRTDAVAAAVVGMSVGDAAAWAVGRRWGGKGFGRFGRTVAGSVANLVATTLAVGSVELALGPTTSPAALGVGALVAGSAATATEAGSHPAYDNPTVLIVLAVLASVLWS